MTGPALVPVPPFVADLVGDLRGPWVVDQDRLLVWRPGRSDGARRVESVTLDDAGRHVEVVLDSTGFGSWASGPVR